MPRLLIVDDDRFLARGLEKLLTAQGYYCQAAVSAEEARRALSAAPFDLLIIDVSLPDQDGFALCRQIRTHFRMPIVFLSARDNYQDKVVGLEVGGDDYLVKPFEPRELVARVRAHLRRSEEYSRPVGQPNVIRIDSLVVDMDQHDAFCQGKAANLTEREFALLLLMARHRSKALATSWIFENVWGFDASMGLKTVAVFIRRLRLKIEADPDNPKFVRTVRGYGYKLADPFEGDGKTEIENAKSTAG